MRKYGIAFPHIEERGAPRSSTNRTGGPPEGMCVSRNSRNVMRKTEETGGLFSAVCMETNIIMSIWEMLRNENSAIMIACAQTICDKLGADGAVARDCGCRIAPYLVRMNYRKKAPRDAFHASANRCAPEFHPHGETVMGGFNSQAREEIRARMGKLHLPTRFSPRMYRMFFRRYCVWRIEYARYVINKASRFDTHNLRSRHANVIQKNRRYRTVGLFGVSVDSSATFYYPYPLGCLNCKLFFLLVFHFSFLSILKDVADSSRICAFPKVLRILAKFAHYKTVVDSSRICASAKKKLSGPYQNFRIPKTVAALP